MQKEHGDNHNQTHFYQCLKALDLHPGNSIVIGSGTMEALGIRRSRDIDLVVADAEYRRLQAAGNFDEKEVFGQIILFDEQLEIGISWSVLDQEQDLAKLSEQSTTIDGVRYVSLEFLLSVKKSWSSKNDAHQKDRDDVQLIEQYLASK